MRKLRFRNSEMQLCKQGRAKRENELPSSAGIRPSDMEKDQGSKDRSYARVSIRGHDHSGLETKGVFY